MYLDIQNWDRAQRHTLDFDPLTYASVPAATFVLLDSVTGLARPFAVGDCAWAHAAQYYIVFKGTEETISTDVSKLDVVAGPCVIETDNWNSANAAIIKGSKVNIEWSGTKAWLDAPSAANYVGFVKDITATGNLVVVLGVA